MNDIVERLRTLEGWNTTGPKALMFEAADEIERLLRVTERQRQQLEDYAHANIADRREIERLRKIEAAAQNLKAVRGRYNSEQALKILEEAMK